MLRCLFAIFMDPKQRCVVSNVWRIVFVTVLFTFFIVIESQATHLRAGDIIVERQNCSSRTFKITVTVYTNTGSPVLFGGEGDLLNFGDGTWESVPETPNKPQPG